MKGSHWPLRIAAAGAMLLCLLCAFLAGVIKGMQAMFLIGQIVFGAAALILVVVFLVATFRKVTD